MTSAPCCADAPLTPQMTPLPRRRLIGAGRMGPGGGVAGLLGPGGRLGCGPGGAGWGWGGWPGGSRWGNGGAGRAGWAAGVAGRAGPGGWVAGRVGPGGGGTAGLVGPGGGGVAGVGRVGRRVGWYGPVAVNVYTARKGVCNGGVKNTLLAR